VHFAECGLLSILCEDNFSYCGVSQKELCMFRHLCMTAIFLWIGAPDAEVFPDSAQRPDTAMQSRNVRRGNTPEVDRMRTEVNSMRAEAEKLSRMAERLDDEVDDVENNMDALLEKANNLQEKVQVAKTLTDSNTVGHGDSLEMATVDRFLDQQKQMVVTLRTNAAALAEKAREMAVKVRTIEVMAEAKESAADSLEDAVDEIQSTDEALPLRHRFQVGMQNRLAVIPVAGEDDFRLMWQGGFNVAYTPVRFMSVGVRDIMLYYNNDRGKGRTAITGAPALTFFSFPAASRQFGGGLSIGIQAQVGAGEDASTALAPAGFLFFERWFGDHFSVGPMLSVHWQAYGRSFAPMAPRAQDNVMSRRAWWSDGGVVVHGHF
jgi:hypothetical protein